MHDSTLQNNVFKPKKTVTPYFIDCMKSIHITIFHFK